MEQKEGSITSRFLNALKMVFFRVMTQTLDFNIVNTPIYILMLLFEFLQITPFLLGVGLRVADKVPEALENYEDIVDTLMSITLNKSILNTSFTVLMAFSFVLFGFFVCIIGLMIYFESRSNLNSFGSRTSQTIVCVIKLFSLIFISFCTYLSFPIFLMLLIPLKCTQVNGESVVNNDTNASCWSGLHIGVVLINIVNFLFFFIFLVMIETLVNESNPKSALPWAGYDSGKIKIVKHLAKVVGIKQFLYQIIKAAPSRSRVFCLIKEPQNESRVSIETIARISHSTLFLNKDSKLRIPYEYNFPYKEEIIRSLYNLTVVIICFFLFDYEASLYHYYFASIIVLEGFTVYLLFISSPYINRLSGFFTLYIQSALSFMMLWMYILRVSDIVVLYIGAALVLIIFLSKAVIMIFAKDCYDHYVLSQQVWETKNISQKAYYFYEIFYYLDNQQQVRFSSP